MRLGSHLPALPNAIVRGLHFETFRVFQGENIIKSQPAQMARPMLSTIDGS